MGYRKFKIQRSKFKARVSIVRCLASCVFFLFVVLLMGCGPKFSLLLSESWSENYALSTHGAEASNSRINDGDIKTWGVVQPPNREYTITFPEEKEINKIVIYSRNVTDYQLFYWDKRYGEWGLAGDIGKAKIKKIVDYEKFRFEILQFDHRTDFKTDKIKLRVKKAESDRIVTTRAPNKDDVIVQHRIEYIGTGRRRKRIDLYDVFTRGPAAIREIEAYSNVEKSEIK